MTKKIYTVTIVRNDEYNDDIATDKKHFLSREAADAYASKITEYIGDDYTSYVDVSTASDNVDEEIVVEAGIRLYFERKTHRIGICNKSIRFYAGLDKNDTPFLNEDYTNDDCCCYYCLNTFSPRDGESGMEFRKRMFSELKEQATKLMLEDLAKRGIYNGK